jgi:hypothetical protein
MTKVEKFGLVLFVLFVANTNNIANSRSLVDGLLITGSGILFIFGEEVSLLLKVSEND